MRSSTVLTVLALSLSVAASGQNLVANGSFPTDLGGWQAFHDSGSAAWSSEDASASASSGSANLSSTAATNGVFVAFLTRCVPVAAGAQYAVSDKARFADGETTTGWAEISIYWVSNPTCAGGYISGNGLLTSKGSSGVWTTTSDTFTAPPGAVAAYVQLGIDKIETGNTLSAWVDDVVFAPAGALVETLAGYLTVAGSVQGAFGSNFKTAVQLLNPGFSAISGHLVFHPAGVSASPSDATIGYSLAPGQTFSWDDIVGTMGQSGLGSMDVFAGVGAAPIVVARIFDDKGAGGTSGFTEPLIAPGDVQGGLGVAVTGFLIGPSDVSRFRYNIGTRTLDAPVSVTATLKDSAGATLTTVTKSYAANFFEQKSSTDFFGGFALTNGDSIEITFSGGGLIVYGATADNVTNDPSAQFMPYVFAIA